MLIALDFETTGLDINRDEPIQIGMVCMTDDFVYVDHYVSLIKPSKSREELKQTVSLLTGLSSDDFYTASTHDIVFAEVAQKIKTREQKVNFYTKNSPDKKSQDQNDLIFVGHNILFDLKIFVKYMEKNALSLDLKLPNCSLSFDSISRYFCLPLFEVYSGLAFIDTYRLAQTCIHFVGSYSLETLKQKLESNELFATTFSNIMQKIQPEAKSKIGSHNALYDCIVSMCLYRFCYDRFQYLTTKYLSKNLSENKKSFSNFSQQHFNKPFFCFFLPTSLPLVSKPLPAQKKLIKKNNDFGEEFCQKNQSDLSPNSSFFDSLIIKIKNFFALPLRTITIDKFVLETIRENKKTIIAFSHSSKLDICKKIYKSFGYDVGFFNENTILDADRFFLRLTKTSYTKSEMFFLYKYLSHLDYGYSVFDITADIDSNIMLFLQGRTKTQTKNIILTTHTGFYYMIKNFKDTYKDYRIFFFDADWRYTTYNNFSNNFFDPYSVLDILEKIQYTYSILADHNSQYYHDVLRVLDRLVNGWIIRMGVFFIEASALCAQYKKHSVFLSSLFDTPVFFRTNHLWDSIQSYLESLASNPFFEHKEYIVSLFKDIYEICKKPLRIESKIFGQDGLYFIITSDVTYTDFSEFLEYLSGLNIIFCSHSIKGKNRLEDVGENRKKMLFGQSLPFFDYEKKNILKVSYLTELSKVINDFCSEQQKVNIGRNDKYDENVEQRKNEKNIFILSGIKKNSQEIVSFLYQSGFHQTWTLLAENITGGRKKNTIKAFFPGENKIIVGGFNFLLGLLSEGWQWDLLVIYQTMGSMEDVMFDDIYWYNLGIQSTKKKITLS